MRIRKILKQKFYDRPVLTVASELIGKYLVCRRSDGTVQSYMISDVEAYDGEKDLACHASKGRTKRTEVMYGPAGYWYVYLCYGMHFMLNVVTGPRDYPAAILVRGLSESTPKNRMGRKIVAHGPGIVSRMLGISMSMNTKPATEISGLWIEDRGVSIRSEEIVRKPRIGVSYAGAWAKKPYRFILKTESTC